ncbi:MAG: choice-of-anchor J domain-containing protein [candidate division WOR-3 bacterium]|nr:choice-of-anchor J domain-containing protein [candidate division WOR-3 bacterium]
MPEKRVLFVLIATLFVSGLFAQSILLNESFTSLTFPPTGWALRNFNGGNAWQRVTISPNTSPACAGIESDGSSRNNDWLMTPNVGPIYAKDSVIFYARIGPYSTSETLYIRISTGASQTDTSQYNIVYKITITSTTWTRFARSLGAYAGSNIYIAFWYRELNRDRVRIDDVVVKSFPPTTHTVTFTANGLPAGTSWTVTWDGTPYTSTTNTITISNVSAGTYNWSVSSPISGGVGVRYVGSPTSGSMNVPGQTSQEITWVTQYQLTMVTNYGTTSPAVGTHWYNAGSVVTISATAPQTGDGERYVWNGWTGSGNGSYSGTNNPEQITLNSPITQTASWTHQYYLTVNSAHSTVNGAGWYDSGAIAYASVVDSIVTTNGTRYVFAGWIGDASGSNLISNPITMDGPKTATANWDIYYYVTYAANVPVVVPDAEWVKSGEAASGIFVSPQYDLSGTTKYVYVSDDRPEAITAPTTITATYDIYYLLTININGPGSVTKDPDYEWYLNGQSVQLTANPNPGAAFTGWSGDLSGNINPTSLIMNAPKNVTATFVNIYRDLGILSIPQPGTSVPICTPFAPTVEVYNYSVPPVTEHCTLDVYIWRYPIKFDTVCQVSRNPNDSILEYSVTVILNNVNPGSNTISLPNWHPQYADLTWLTNPTYHVIHARVRMSADQNLVNDRYRKQFNVSGIENDLQVNGLTLLKGQSLVRTDTVAKAVTYNTMSSVSNNSPTRRITVRSYIRIIRVKTNSVIFSRYLDYTLNPRSYICLLYSSGVTFQDTGLYKMETWIQTAAGADVTPNNNRMEKFFYVKYIPGNVQGNDGLANLYEYDLFNAAPNPFANFTEIRWQIPKTSRVKIAIYNAAGQLIKTLADSHYEAGEYRTRWERTDNYGRRVSAGIYFYELTTPEYTMRKKLIIAE